MEIKEPRDLQDVKGYRENLDLKGYKGEQGPPGPQGSPGAQGARGNAGVTYVRWGKSSCPNVSGTQLVYAGRAGGSEHMNQGGGAEKICVPTNPDYINAPSSTSATLYKWGTLSIRHSLMQYRHSVSTICE